MTQTDAPEQDEHEHDHPGVREYVEIAAILGVLTAIEVALYFADLARQVTIPALLVLTAMKFVLVVLWFMHLRFDSPHFRRIFWFGVALAGVLYSGALAALILTT